MDNFTLTVGMEDVAYICEALEMLKKKKLSDAKRKGTDEFDREILRDEANEIEALFKRIDSMM